jgi:hypothetical protein
MTASETAAAMLDLDPLRDPPSAAEFGVIEAQIGRAAILIETFAESRLLEIGGAYETTTGCKTRLPALNAPATV